MRFDEQDLSLTIEIDHRSVLRGLAGADAPGCWHQPDPVRHAQSRRVVPEHYAAIVAGLTCRVTGTSHERNCCRSRVIGMRSRCCSLMPALFILIMSLALQGGFEARRKVQVDYYFVDEAGTQGSASLMQLMDETGSFRRMPD